MFGGNQRIRLTRKGCSFFLGGSKIHLMFPKFTISDDIWVNEDLRIQLDPLTDEDWKIPNTICDGTIIHNQGLDHFGTRLDMVNEILRGKFMTHVKKQNQDSFSLANNNDDFDATQDSTPRKILIVILKVSPIITYVVVFLIKY